MHEITVEPLMVVRVRSEWMGVAEQGRPEDAAVNAISLLSSLAMLVGLAAALPQILQMARTRSAGGQSVLGWGMGLVTNLSMAYVNLFGFGAAPLMASNLVSAALCVAAIGLILRYGTPAAQEDAVAAGALPLATVAALREVSAPCLHASFTELPTTEFAAIQDAVRTAGEHRATRPEHRRPARGSQAAEALAQAA